MLNILKDKNQLTGAAGNIIEWYDFSLYSYFAPILAKTFFPTKYGFRALALTWLVFAISFAIRPLGGVIFGFFGDRLNTSVALFWSIVLITLCSLSIGLLPPFHSIGWLAPVILIILRLLQGISAGGQYSGSLVYFAEHNQNSRAQAATLAYWGSLAGYILASLIGWLTFILLPEQNHTTIWRIPFLLTILFLPLLFYYKNHIINEEKKLLSSAAKTPIIKLLQDYPRHTIKMIVLASFGGFFYSANFAFLLTYFKYFLKLSFHDIFFINTICLVSTAISTYIFAKLSDRLGRRPLLIAGALSLAIVAYPSFALMQQAHFNDCLLGAWLLTTANSCFIAAVQPIYAESFPHTIRYTGCAVSFNLGTGLIGGLTPLALSFIAHHFDWQILMLTALLIPLSASLFIFKTIPETYHLATKP